MISIVDSFEPDSPIHAVVYGPNGIGKSTFGSTAPGPVFVASERGHKFMRVRRINPFPMTYGDVLKSVAFLAADKSCETIVIDSLDWLEPLLHAHVCERDKEASIESYGYGKGYVAAAIEWRDLLSRLDATEKHVVLIAHARRKSVRNTIGADYDAIGIKLHETASSIVTEWADVVGYADLDTEVEEEKRGSKAVTNGKRILRMTPHPGLTVKVRAPEDIKVPSRVPLTWYSIMRALGRASVDNGKKEEA